MVKEKKNKKTTKTIKTILFGFCAFFLFQNCDNFGIDGIIDGDSGSLVDSEVSPIPSIGGEDPISEPFLGNMVVVETDNEMISSQILLNQIPIDKFGLNFSQPDSPTVFFPFSNAAPTSDSELFSLTSFWAYAGTIYHVYAKGSQNKPFQFVKMLSTCDRNEDANYFCKKHVFKENVEPPLFTEFAGNLTNQSVTDIVDLWIMGFYYPALPSKEKVLAFIHEETQNRIPNSRIGLAWSNDSGKTWRYLGRIVNSYDGAAQVHNLEGVPYIVKDGYFYIYFKDRSLLPSGVEIYGVAVARAPIQRVLDAARDGTGDVGQNLWRKLTRLDSNNCEWNETGLGLTDTTHVPALLGIPGITHTQAVYSITKNKFYMITTVQSLTNSLQSSNNQEPTWVKLFESQDGLHWNFVVDVANEYTPLISLPSGGNMTLDFQRAGYQYCSMTDQFGAINQQVRDSFYIYCYRFNILNFPNVSPPTQESINEKAGVTEYKLIRWKINLNSSL